MAGFISNFKENYSKGNNFIFSPNGKISRKRYLLYAILLDILYRVTNAITRISKDELSFIFYISAIFVIFVIILKFFNYKKRAYGFLNNNLKANLFTIIYMLFGFLTVTYAYLLKLATNKFVYETISQTQNYNGTFDEFSNVNVPTFITSPVCTTSFYIICGLGFLMFLYLLLCPNKNDCSQDVSVKKDSKTETGTNTKTDTETETVKKKS